MEIGNSMNTFDKYLESEKRYLNDQCFCNLVDVITNALIQKNIDLDYVLDAAKLALTRYKRYTALHAQHCIAYTTLPPL